MKEFMIVLTIMTICLIPLALAAKTVIVCTPDRGCEPIIVLGD